MAKLDWSRQHRARQIYLHGTEDARAGDHTNVLPAPPFPKSRKFTGSFAELRDLFARLGIRGEWRALGKQKQFRAETGGVVNWWPSTGTLQYQGNAVHANELARILAKYTRPAHWK
jgi:hypothetical protein